MSAKHDRTYSVNRAQAKKFFTKARQYLESAQLLLENERFDAAGLAAIHSAIAASDATLGFAIGARSAAQDHMAVVALLSKQVDEFGATQQRQLVGLLRMKSTIAYDDRLISQDEAWVLVAQAERYCNWASETIKRHK